MDYRESRLLRAEDVPQVVQDALKRMKYGEIVIKVEQGQPVWVEVHEKTRVG